MSPKSSVGKRLLLLILFQLSVIGGISTYSLITLHHATLDTDQMYRFQLLSIADLATTLEKTTSFQQVARSGASVSSTPIESPIQGLDEFVERYKTEYHATHSDSDDAREFHENLVETGHTDLLKQELSDFEGVESALALAKKDPKSNVALTELRANLADLLNTNIEYAEIANQMAQERASSSKIWLFILSGLGFISTLVLGWYVHWTISPRIKRLVSKVEKFKEFGINEKIIEKEKDELTILTHAIDSGFSAIAEREKEREKFLNSVSHELKTPLTLIYGYASVLEKGTSMSQKMVSMIHKQAWRLNRLIEDLFMAQQVRSGKVTLHLSPLDFSQLATEVALEVEAHLKEKGYQTVFEPNIRVIGDSSSLRHALWGLFACAATLSKENKGVNISLSADSATAVMSVHLSDDKTLEDLEALFNPFSEYEYEDGEIVRSTVGLQLSRTIARLHHGDLKVAKASAQRPTLTLTLPL